MNILPFKLIELLHCQRKLSPFPTRQQLPTAADLWLGSHDQHLSPTQIWYSFVLHRFCPYWCNWSDLVCVGALSHSKAAFPCSHPLPLHTSLCIYIWGHHCFCMHFCMYIWDHILPLPVSVCVCTHDVNLGCHFSAAIYFLLLLLRWDHWVTCPVKYARWPATLQGADITSMYNHVLLVLFLCHHCCLFCFKYMFWILNSSFHAGKANILPTELWCYTLFCRYLFINFGV